MQRVDTATAIATLPAQNPAGTPGYFSQGSPTGSPPATVPGQDWFNAVQEEIIAVIVAAGITPDKSNNAQLLAAIQSIWPVPARHCLLSISSAVPTVSGSFVTIAWTVENNDPYDLHAINSSRVICPVGYNRVRAFANISWAPTTTGLGRRHMQVLKNGASGIGQPFVQDYAQASGQAITQNMSGMWLPCIAGDYFELGCDQTSGETINIQATGQTWFGVEFMKAT